MRKILIVDDSAVNRILLGKLLQSEYSTTEVENGLRAVEYVRDNRDVSAVLMDIVMPVMDGYEALRIMRDDPGLAHIPIIMVTGSEDEESRVKALSLGANDFIVKPFSPELIRHCVKNNIALSENSLLINAMRRDKLTGLYNREFFFEKAAEMISGKEPGYYVLSCYDMDNFKFINDQFGAAEGDRVLRHAGRYLNNIIENVGGICGRISGDNFAALFKNDVEIIKKLGIDHRESILPEGIHTTVSYSTGRCVADDPSLPVTAIYDRAYIAKQSVKGRYDTHIAYFDESMLEKLVEEQKIIIEMDNALNGHQFEVWFQPQYNHSTGALIGAEALVRWRHPERGLIPPVEFIPVFENNGFIYELDKYVWNETCVHLRKWLDTEEKVLPVSVNISRHDIFRDDFYDCVTGLVEKYRIPVELLRLEITESAFAESGEQIISVVKRLILYGFTVEIDDFGSGYSSLNTLKNVPAQVIKLDMRFLESGDDSQRGGNIIESIIRMAKWLGMSVIAEGVETKEQADYLRSVGCSYIQGYFYSKPMKVSDYEQYYKKAGKENHLETLETVENLNNNTFWDPKSMDTLIFNSYVGAACIFEYQNGNIELLRVNQKFAAILGNGSISVEDTLRLDWISCLTPESLKRVREILLNSAKTGEEYTAEYRFLNIAGCDPEIYLRATMRVIAVTEARMLVYCTCENITAQRHAEERERLATGQIRSMLDDMPGGFVKLLVGRDGKTRPVYINEGYSKLTGLSREEIENTCFGEVTSGVYVDDIETVNSAVKNMLSGGELVNVRFRQLCGNGEYKWFSVVGRATVDVTGETFLNLFFGDATEQVKKEETQKNLLDNLPCGVGVYEFKNGQMSLEYQNKSYWELVGLYKAEFPDPSPMSAIHPDDMQKIMDELMSAIAHNRDVTCDIRLRHLTLGYRPVHLAARVIPNGAESMLIYATFTPNSKCNTQEDVESRCLSDQLQAILNNAGQGILASVVRDGKTHRLFANERYYEMLGYTREQFESEIKERAITIQENDRERVKQELGRAVRSGKTAVIEYGAICKNGKNIRIRMSVSTSNIAGISEPVQLSFFDDITSEKE